METLLNIEEVERKALRQAREGVALACRESELEKLKSASTLTERLKQAFRREEETYR